MKMKCPAGAHLLWSIKFISQDKIVPIRRLVYYTNVGDIQKQCKESMNYMLMEGSAALSGTNLSKANPT